MPIDYDHGASLSIIDVKSSQTEFQTKFRDSSIDWYSIISLLFIFNYEKNMYCIYITKMFVLIDVGILRFYNKSVLMSDVNEPMYE